jgi:hypothetical protein
MLPYSLGLPAAILLVLGGALACFAGYRLFRSVLGIYGFILGAMIASSMLDVSNPVGLLVAALLGGIVGAIVFVFAYLVGVGLAGAGLGALIAHLVWVQLGTSDPPAAAVIVASVTGAVGAILLQRYVIVAATAFGGAWTIILGGVAIAETTGGDVAAAAPDVWILYPFSPALSETWVIVAWVTLGLTGLGVQLWVTARRRKSKR